MHIRDRIKEFRTVKGRDLLPNPKNWRTHPTAQADAMRGLLAEVGQVDVLRVVETPRGFMLVDGHLRAEITPDADWKVAVLDLTPAEADKVLATFDPVAGMAEPDPAKLAALLDEIETESEAVAAMIDELNQATGTAANVAAADLPALPSGDREPFQQMTFTLHDDQAEAVKQALAKAKEGGTADINENSNGNALARIAEAYLALG